MLFGHRISGGAKSFADGFVGVEINLPVVIGVAVGAHGEYRAIEIELENFDIRGRIGFDVGDLTHFVFEQFDRFVMIHRVGELSLQIDAADGFAEKF